ncbi:hypothetical protein EGW08_000454 [Elysia chlorotica]|uniref:Sulfatase N-terminal domain-containing protein n=1 Tax=Elysia chlorotica TaxID=188477 RepID=A0A433UD58_ELYCH|nr:hypothetical protein EGW08_000454 [Elysia chlorotica]
MLVRHALILAVLLLPTRAVALRTRPPNIVFIVADDYGHRDIGYHGAEFATPTLDSLAAGGVKLENYYVQPICSPSRSQLMTGRYQIHTGLQHSIIWPSQPYGLPLQYPTLANLLKDQGYSTHAIGKWHLGLYKEEYTPLYRGFDTFYGYWTGGEDYYTYRTCDRVHYDQAIAEPPSADGKFCGLDLRDMDQPVTDKNGTYSTLLYTEKAVQLIQSAATSEKPFFLYLAYQAVHDPLEAPDSYIKPYNHIQDQKRRIYAGMVSALDEGVKNVTDALEQNELWDNTVLIFTTDNGGEVHSGGNNWPLRGAKHTLWEGGVKGVGFVTSPLLSEGQKGKVSTDMMHVSDWFPTVADIVGAKVNSSLALDGFSQWNMIRDGKASERKEILHNIDILFPQKGKKLFNDTFDTRVRASIRVGDYKLLCGDPGDGTWWPVPSIDQAELTSVSAAERATLRESRPRGEPAAKNLWLFNIRDDPSERYDLSASEPEVVRRLLDRISHYNSTALPPQFPPSDPACDPKLHGGFWGPWR